MPIFDAQRRRPRRQQVIPFSAERVSGLNLRDDPQELGWTAGIDAKNVAFDLPGRIRQRSGYLSFATAPSTVLALGTHNVSGHLLFGYQGSGNGRVRAINNIGGTVDTYTSLSAGSGRVSFASMGIISGGADVHRTYASMDKGPFLRYDGTTFTLAAAPAAANGGVIAVQPNDNRLVMASGSTVNFSNSGDPETWGANDYVTLDPGDGEKIVALAVFNDQLFAFKQSKFYVFYGNSTDSTGATVFNYRDVSGGVGVSYDKSTTTNISYGVAAARDGIYFIHDTGLYRTTGGTAELMSRDIAPMFTQSSPVSLPSGLRAVELDGERVVTAFEDKILVSYYTASNPMANTLVYDTVDRSWSYWTLGASPMISYFDGTNTRLAFAKQGSAVIYRYGNPSWTTDDGATIASKFQSGYSDLGSPEAEKVLLELLVVGTNQVTVAVARNHPAENVDSSSSLSFSSHDAQGRHAVASKGRNFSYILTDNGVFPWTVSRVVGHRLGEREPGTMSQVY